MTSPAVRVVDEAGTTRDEPSAGTLAEMLAELTEANRFLILERLDRAPAGHHYLQVYLNDDRSLQVEYRDGGAARHFEAEIPASDAAGDHPLAGLFADYAAGGSDWRDALPWQPLVLE